MEGTPFRLSLIHICISLVRPQEDDALYGEDGYVHLELRYNDYDDLTGRRSPGAV